MISTQNTDEQLFLEGPQSRTKEFLFTLRVLRDLIRGFRKFHFLGPCATVFGSARFKEDHEYYTKARAVGSELSKLGFTVMTGGGPGIMEAANRGAKDVGGRSVGCNIVLPKEQDPNKYLDHWVYINYFFVRKVLLMKYSFAFIVMPGGYGTMDEFFEAITLVQTKKIRSFPVVLIGKEFHKKLWEHIERLKEAGTISPEDHKLFLFTDDIQEAMEFIKVNGIKQFELIQKSYSRPMAFLGEKGL